MYKEKLIEMNRVRGEPIEVFLEYITEEEAEYFYNLFFCQKKCNSCERLLPFWVIHSSTVYTLWEWCPIWERKSKAQRFLKILEEDYPHYSFSTFRFLPYTKTMMEMKENIEKDTTHLWYLYGDTGIGKTHFVVSMAKEMLKKEILIFFISVLDIVRKVRQILQNEEDDTVFWEFLKNQEILVIDDCGAEKQNEYFQERFLDVIDTRLRKKKGTGIVSNLLPDQLPYEKRIKSRLHAFTLYEVKGIDKRRNW